MNNDTYTPCTKCGRPMAYCKGQCCGQPKGCDCKEYCSPVRGAIRQCDKDCPHAAVIPSITVDHAENLNDLCDTFIHVSDINTTFYVDDKHRTIITWAGTVEYDNYDLVANSLNLRGQFLMDRANSIGAYYDKTGAYQTFRLNEAKPLNFAITFNDLSGGSGSGDVVAQTLWEEFREYVGGVYDYIFSVSITWAASPFSGFSGRINGGQFSYDTTTDTMTAIFSVYNEAASQYKTYKLTCTESSSTDGNDKPYTDVHWELL